MSGGGLGSLIAKAKGKCGTPMAMALILWICSLPLVFLVVWPFLGAVVAAVASLGLLILVLVFCWAVCLGRVGL